MLQLLYYVRLVLRANLTPCRMGRAIADTHPIHPLASDGFRCALSILRELRGLDPVSGLIPFRGASEPASASEYGQIRGPSLWGRIQPAIWQDL